jgi:hypothetical protein
MPKSKNKRRKPAPRKHGTKGYRPTLSIVDELAEDNLIEIQRERLPNDVKAWTETYHSYICDVCIEGYATVDLDEGATPMFGPCLRTEGCEGTARSMMDFNPKQYEGFPLLIEWYRPKNLREIRNESSAVASHVIRGGLMRRASKDAPKWVKEVLK